MRKVLTLGLVFLMALVAVPGFSNRIATAQTDERIPIRLQLQWVAQSQFAGYYAAQAKGFYADEGLDVTILEGAVDIIPQQVVASGAAEFGIAWVPKVLASREQGVDLVNIAQIFQRSGTLQVALADSGIETIDDLRGKRVGTWGFGQEHELFAALRMADIDPDNPDDVTIVQQPFDMSLLINGEVDAAQAMIYNEYAMVLEHVDPETGELMYTEDDLNVIDFNTVGTAMLQDHVFVDADWLAQEGNEAIAVKFLRASFRGWVYCRENFDECVDIVLENGTVLGQGHMRWMLNEVNQLVWPAPQGIGVMDEALWEQTARVALEGGIISTPPDAGAYRTDLAQAAFESLQADFPEMDLTGETFEPIEVQITPGGE